MTLVGSSCKAGTANLTVNLTMLVVGGCSSQRFVCGILLFRLGLAYLSQDAFHEFCLGQICKQTNPSKQSNEDIERLLQANWVPRGNKAIVEVKRHQYFSHLIANSISCSVFVKHLTKPLPDYSIDTHI